MLIKVSAENFLSFDSNTELAMLTSNKIRENAGHRVKIKSTQLLRNAAVYGANASGKSNLIEIFTFFKETLKHGLPIEAMQMFCKTNEANEKRESSFELQMTIGENFYAYGFSAILSQRRITGEWVYELHQDGTAKRIFDRDTNGKPSLDGDFHVSAADMQKFQTYAEDFEGNTTTLFLSEMNRNKKYSESSKLAVFKRIFTWLVNNIIIITPNEPVTKFEYYYDNESLSLVNKMIDTFDTGITDVKIEEITAEELKNKLPAYIYENVMSKIKDYMDDSEKSHYRVTMHSNTSFFNIEGDRNQEPKITTIRLRHGNSFFSFDFEDESDGTRQLFDLLDMLMINTDDVVFVVDELERSLHPKLTQHFLELFNEIHSEHRVQLLFTTHEASVMDQSLFRRDEIWFIERNTDNISILYSLDKFKERYDKVLSKAYLEGRYGAIPVFKSFSINDSNGGEE